MQVACYITNGSYGDAPNIYAPAVAPASELNSLILPPSVPSVAVMPPPPTYSPRLLASDLPAWDTLHVQASESIPYVVLDSAPSDTQTVLGENAVTSGFGCVGLTDTC